MKTSRLIFPILLLLCMACLALAQRRPAQPAVQSYQFTQQNENSATYSVIVKFPVTTTQFNLQATCTYKDSDNNSYNAQSNTKQITLTTSGASRTIRVSIPIPRGWSYVTGSLKLDNQTITPSSVTNFAVYARVTIPADNQNHTVSISLTR